MVKHLSIQFYLIESRLFYGQVYFISMGLVGV